MSTQSAIHWPDHYLPGTTDNFVSNEIIVKNLSAKDVWTYLSDTSVWSEYYSNVSDISFPHGGGPKLVANQKFKFGTFGFPPLAAEVVEFVAPTDSEAGRLSWTAKQDGTPDEKLDESQIGEPAATLAKQIPNPMLNGHQAWLDGLRDIALKNKK
ncbi:hypothetical protein K501DRAFT_295012 [Backusella circina FSU 941]|nr:hypothetical protein K501DRAFT_295012 [Backusella circina FSU 941]